MSERPDDAEYTDLGELVASVQMVSNPRVAFIVTEEGTVHFATSIAPHEAAAALEEMAEIVRSHNCNHARRHFDRAAAAQMN